jgi:hypothetical protein
MSVNAVTGTSLQRDLVSALRQARAASAQQVDASALTAASQEPGAAEGATQSTGSTSQASTSASTPTLSNDLMASLLQLQSDFSQMGLQTGVTTPADAAANADDASTTGASASDQTTAGAAPVRHHHHGRAPAADATDDTQAQQSGDTTDATAATTASTSSATASTETGSDLQAFLQQVTKAISAYAAGGPLGIAAALTSTAKA